MKDKVPRFMIDSSLALCSPVTIYTARKDGTFHANCLVVPGGLEVTGEDFAQTVALASQAYLDFCRTAIWN